MPGMFKGQQKGLAGAEGRKNMIEAREMMGADDIGP